MLYSMNGKAVYKQFIHRNCSFDNFPFFVDMLWIEHFANQLFLVFNDSGRNFGSGALRLIEVQYRERQRLVSI